jgi:hypothetical protein
MSDTSGHQDVTVLLLNTQFTVIAKTKAFRFLLTTSSKAKSSCRATGCSAAKEFPAFYKARKFIIIFIRVRHCIISLISRIHYSLQKLRFNIILTSIIRLRLPLVSSLHVYNQRFVPFLNLSLDGACSGHASTHKHVFTVPANSLTTSLTQSFTATISLSQQHNRNKNGKFRGRRKAPYHCHQAAVNS